MLCDQLFQQAQGCRIETSVCIFLNFVRDTPSQQIRTEGLWRLGFERRAPFSTKCNDQHSSKPIDFALDRGAQIVRRHPAGARIQGPALIRERIHDFETTDTDAPFVPRCQSFLDNDLADLGTTGAFDYRPRLEVI
jgi:hypothetical protein